MAEEHLSTTPEGQEAPKNGDKLKPQDFTCEIDSQLTQLICLSELLRKLEDAGPGEMRNGCFYGLADIIEGCADRIDSMADATYKWSYERGGVRALEKAMKDSEAEETLLRVTAREIEEMAAHLVKLRQDPEFDFDLQAQVFIKSIGELRKYLERFFKKVGVLQEESA